MKKTLVIHPQDSSTDFLEIFKGKDWTIETNCSTSHSVRKELIKNHDRIIMMGHGTPAGLLNVKHWGYIIDHSYVDLLKQKECVFIWCNADIFVESYGLKGLYSGMVISEVGEAAMFRIPVSQKEIDYSNNKYAEAVSKGIFKEDAVNIIKENYNENSPVFNFNRERIYLSS